VESGLTYVLDLWAHIAADHAFLRDGLEQIAAERHSEIITIMVGDIAEYLELHFRQEEEPGRFFDAIVARAPQYTDKIAILRAEHQQLMALCSRIKAATEGKRGPAGRDLLQEVTRLVALLRAHEKAEYEMLRELCPAAERYGEQPKC